MFEVRDHVAIATANRKAVWGGGEIFGKARHPQTLRDIPARTADGVGTFVTGTGFRVVRQTVCTHEDIAVGKIERISWPERQESCAEFLPIMPGTIEP